MSDKKNETIADIVAEMRGRADVAERVFSEEMATGKIVLDQYAREFITGIRKEADRIETAWKREKAECEALALSVGGMVEASRHKQVGNSAAMREALKAVVDSASEIMERVRHKDGLAFNIANSLIGVAQSPLAAPPRNCDLYATVDEAMDDFADEALIEEWNALKAGKGRDMLAEELFMFAKWLFATVAKRKGEDDGSK